VVQIDGLFKLVKNGLAPKAMIVKDVETVLVVTAFIAQVPLVDRLERDPLEAISTGDLVKVDANKGTVTITKNT
jgi:predicted aconitase with swiveling domain